MASFFRHVEIGAALERENTLACLSNPPDTKRFPEQARSLTSLVWPGRKEAMRWTAALLSVTAYSRLPVVAVAVVVVVVVMLLLLEEASSTFSRTSRS